MVRVRGRGQPHGPVDLGGLSAVAGPALVGVLTDLAGLPIAIVEMAACGIATALCVASLLRLRAEYRLAVG